MKCFLCLFFISGVFLSLIGSHLFGIQNRRIPKLRCQTESRYVQTVPDGMYLCPDRHRRKVPMSKLSCVHQTFVRSCPDFCAFTRLSCIHIQSFVRSSDNSCINDQTFVRSPDFRAFNGFSCVEVQIFVCSADFSVFNEFLCVHVQTSVR